MPELHDLTPHISQLSLVNATLSNIYVVCDPPGHALVDPGPVGTAPSILAMDRRGDIRLRRLLVTHAHPAHAGSLARVVRGTGVPAYVHPSDAPFLDGREPPLLPHGRRGKLIAALGKVVELCPPLFRLEPLLPEMEIAGMTALHLPGHTPGQVCLLHAQDRTLLSGDALLYDGSHLHLPEEDLSEDPAQARASLAALRPLSFENLLPGHGPPLLGGADQQVRRFLDQLGVG
jgi:glyoxylase-like metal-dependent hydrolase (beta-lactamase superfamily II)